MNPSLQSSIELLEKWNLISTIARFQIALTGTTIHSNLEFHINYKIKDLPHT